MSYTPRYAPRQLGRSSERRLGHRLGLAGVLLATVLALAGCVNLQLKATVHSDNTVSGTVRVGFAKSLAALAGGTSGLLGELKSGQDSPCDFGGKKGTMHDYDDGT